ncbi:unnamed protein product [Prunus armeniaca]|uniref:Uncharacterized protein n=1 Tax=Prunus armeniaca TaxID=36596 RepID=A0A6J5VAN4_PRUAR|nr:unnamed protein product [Prunus armeniaca]
MDGREQHFQSLSICRRLYNIISRSLAYQTVKTVTLGPPMKQGLAQLHDESMPQKTSGNNTSNNLAPSFSLGCSADHADVDNGFYGNAGRTPEEETHEAATIAQQAKPPKKTVSICDRVEDMEKAMKLRRRSKSFEKLNWLELAKEELKQKPLRSILKVGSGLSKKMAHVCES